MVYGIILRTKRIQSLAPAPSPVTHSVMTMEKKPGVRREERAGLDSSIPDKFLLLPCTGSRASFTRVNASQINGKMTEKDTYYQPVGVHHMLHTLPIIIDIY